MYSFIKYALCAFVLLLSLTLSSQSGPSPERSSLTGELLGANGDPIAYATVALMLDDSVFVSGTLSSEAGTFAFADFAPGSYRLKIDHLGYESQLTTSFILSPGDRKSLPAILLGLSTNDLNEVVVKGDRKPLIEVRADKIVFNVADSPSAAGINGLDLLKRSPGVSVDMDDNISLMGKSGVRIFINDVPSRLSGTDLSTFLQSLSSDNIQSIEIISNPSAKYDAEGNGGIINIRTKKNPATGTNGSLTSSFNQGQYLRYNNGLALSYAGERISANFDVTQFQQKGVDGFLDTKRQNGATLLLDSREVTQTRGVNVAVGVNVRLTDEQTIDLSARSVISRDQNRLASQTDIFNTTPDQLSSVLFSRALTDLPAQNHSLNLNHRWQLNDASSWSTSLSVGDYTKDQFTRQPNTFFASDGETTLAVEDSEFNSDTKIKLWSAKTDYEQSWEKVNLALGLKYSDINTRNGFGFYDYEAGEPLINPDKSSDFNYSERVAALYASAGWQLSKPLHLRAGLRVEHTRSRGRLISDMDIANRDVPRRYTDLFPNLGLSFDNGSKYSWSLSYGRRIMRPNYQNLNPFESPISQLTIWKGNPFLRPAYTTNYQASFAYNQKLVVTSTYSRTSGYFASIIEVLDGNRNQVIPRNMELTTNVGLSVSYPMKVAKFWEATAFLNGSLQTYAGDLEGTIIDLTATTYNLSLQNNVKLPGGILLDLTYNLGSDWIWRGSIRVRGNQALNVGLRKDFLDKRLQIRLTGADVFQTTNNYFYEGNYGGLDIKGVRYFDSRQFGLGATWKFGNQQAKAAKRAKGALDDELGRIGS